MSANSSGERPAYKILVVDDEPDLRGIVAQFLERAGYTVAVAGSGNEAFEVLCTQGDFSLIISDIQMPDGDGISLYRRLSELGPQRPKFTFMTGYAEPSVQDPTFPRSEGFLKKPFTSRQLITRVQQLLGGESHT